MKKFGIFCVCSVVLSTTQANPVDFIGYKPVTISTQTTSSNGYSVITKPKVIFVQKIALSPEAKIALKGRINEMEATAASPYQAATINSTSLPKSVNLGMNGTPVLDQGAHGTCVTFAVTGVIDAAIGKGDYVSQLCSLSLGTYLANMGKISYSGWDGSWGSTVLNQLNTYGVFPISVQKASGCAGVRNYPLNNANDTAKPMTIAQYMIPTTKPLSSFVSWGILADPTSTFSPNYKGSALLAQVKNKLSKGNRLTFGMLLDDTQGDAGALGSYRKTYDTWVLTPSIIAKAKNGRLDAGHEMIIIGYNDAAIAKTRDGKTSTGLLILRNSWGKYAGDGGNYYMSYDYFIALADEAAFVYKK